MSGRRQNADIADTLHLRDVAMATPFCLSKGYPMKTIQDIADYEVLRHVAMATIFGFLYMGCTLAPPDEYD